MYNVDNVRIVHVFRIVNVCKSFLGVVMMIACRHDL